MNVATTYRFRDDWYVVTPDQALQVGHAPGVQYDDKRALWIVPRNMLPLLNLEPARRDLPTSEFGDGETKLRPHQEEGVDFLCSRRGTLLADGMRIGKTGQIVAAHDPDSGPLVVVAPLATRAVWVNWFKRRWPDMEPAVLTGREYDPSRVRDAKAIFVHYDVLPGWVSMGIGRRIGTLALDEAHLLSNRKSKRTQTALVIAPQAERIVCATGTPLWNKPSGLYSLLTICNPGAWSTWSDFTIAYCDGRPGSHGWLTGAATNVDEFKDRLRQTMLRRVWRDLVDDLIPTERTILPVEVSERDARELDLLMMQLSDESDYKTLVGQMARYRRIVGKYKAPAAAKIAERATPSVVWVWHKSVATRVAETLTCPNWIINGQTPEHKREDILDEWRAASDGVLIMSLAVGQAGIDLSHASRCVFAELDWTPAVIGQAEMRTFDPSRADHVTYIVADHDIDEKLAKVLAVKCEQALLLGVPAADTAIEMLKQILGTEVEEDLDALVARMRKRVCEEGTTFL